MNSQKRICPKCGASNNGVHTHCLLCQTELPPVDRGAIAPISSFATQRPAASAAPSLETGAPLSSPPPAGLGAGPATVRSAPTADHSLDRGLASPAYTPAEVPAVDLVSPPPAELPGRLTFSELLRRGPLTSIGVGCASVLLLLACAGCSLLALRLITNLR